MSETATNRRCGHAHPLELDSAGLFRGDSACLLTPADGLARARHAGQGRRYRRHSYRAAWGLLRRCEAGFGKSWCSRRAVAERCSPISPNNWSS